VQPSRNRRAFSLIEILIAVVLAGLCIVVYLSLSASETRWTRELDNRAKALALAENTLALVEGGDRTELLSGALQSDGSRLLDDPDGAVPGGTLIFGVALFEWVATQRTRGGLQWQLSYLPAPLAGVVRCKVAWKDARGQTRHVSLQSTVVR